MAVKVYGELTPASTLGILGDAKTIIDRKHGGKMQEDINTDVVDRISDKDFDVDSGKGLGRILLKKGKSLASQVTNANTVYIIQDDLQIGGGSAKLNTADSMTIGSTSYFYTEVTVGTGETITVESTLIIAVQNSGYQWVSEGTSYTAQSDTVVRVCAIPYAVEKVDYTFTGQSTLTIPANCALKFDGGSISGGTIVFDNTKLENPKFNCLYSGNVLVDLLDDRGFASASDDNCLSWLITQALLLGIKLTINRDYTINITNGISGHTMYFVDIPNETLVQGAEIDFGGHTVTDEWAADSISTIKMFIYAGNNVHGLKISNGTFKDIYNNTHRFSKSSGMCVLATNGDCDNITLDNLVCIGGDGVYRHGGYTPAQNLVTTGVSNSTFKVKVKEAGYSLAIYRGVNLDINVESIHPHRGLYLCGVENSKVRYRGVNPSETHCNIMCGEESHYLTDEALAVAKEKAAAGVSDLSQYTGWDMIGCSNIDIIAEILPNPIEQVDITSSDTFVQGGITYYGKSIIAVIYETITLTEYPQGSGATIWYKDGNGWHNTNDITYKVTTNDVEDVKIVSSSPNVSISYTVSVSQFFVGLGSYGIGDSIYTPVFSGRTSPTRHRNIRLVPTNRNVNSTVTCFFNSFYEDRDDMELHFDNIELCNADLSKVSNPILLKNKIGSAALRFVGCYCSGSKPAISALGDYPETWKSSLIIENSEVGRITASVPFDVILFNSKYTDTGSPTPSEYVKLYTYPNYSVNADGENGNAGYGITANRPTYDIHNTGSMYFDTTLKKPVFWTGTEWVDPSGGESSLPVGTMWYDNVQKKSVYWNGTAWTDPFSGNTSFRKLLDMRDANSIPYSVYYDTVLKKQLYWNGLKWIDEEGFTSAKSKGATSDRPLARYASNVIYPSLRDGRKIYIGYTGKNVNTNVYQTCTAIDDTTYAITWENEADVHSDVDIPSDAPRQFNTMAARDEGITAEYAYNNLYVGYDVWINNLAWPTYIKALNRTGAGTTESPYVYSIEWAVRVYYGDVLTASDTGYEYYDTTIGKMVYAKSILSDGAITWVEADGAKAGVQRTGTTAQRPAGNDIYVGFEYFDTELGKPIYASAIAVSSPYTVTWVDTDGNKADSRKLGLVTQRPALSDIVTGFAYIITQDFTATIEDPISGEPGETVSCKAGVYTYILPIQSWATPMGSIIADSDFPSRT